jgi:hypothetical protein
MGKRYIAGLRASEDTLANFTAEELKQPCIFQIVNTKTGNRYIGVCTDPSVRRALYYYNIKHYWKYSSSNTFFGNLKLAKDVKEHGPDVFEYEVIKLLDTSDQKLMLAEKERHIATVERDKLYNRIREFGYVSSPFSEIDEKMGKLVADCYKAQKDFEHYKAAVQARRPALAEERQETIALYQAGKLSKREHDKILVDIQAEFRDLMLTKKQLQNKFNDIRLSVKCYESALEKKYAGINVPTY